MHIHNNDVTNTPVTLTSMAIEKVKQIKLEQQIPDSYSLRIGIKEGGCKGFSYAIGFDNRGRNDVNYEFDGLNVIVRQGDLLQLGGIQIDWSNDLNKTGFVFKNPNAKSSCGCGSSFNV